MAKGTDVLSEIKSLVESIESEPDKFTRTDQVKPEGFAKVILHVVYGVDANGDLHALVDANGVLKSDVIETWTEREVDATFTKTGGAGTGILSIGPASGDTIVLCYTRILMGAAKANTGGALNVFPLSTNSNMGDLVIDPAYAANEFTSIPGRGTAPNASGNLLQPSSFGLLIFDGDVLTIQMGTMSDTETFTVNGMFVSKGDEDLVVTVSGGTLT